MNKKEKSHQVNLALPVFFQSKEILLNLLKEKQSIRKALASTLFADGKYSEAMLFELMTTNHHVRVPYAALSAIGSGFSADNGWWLRVDPTELKVDGGNVYLVGSDHLELIAEEVEQVLASLNNLLIEDNLEIKAGSAHEWFLCLCQSPEIETYPLHEILAKDIRPYMPKGPKEKYWQKLLTECQMLLFAQQINTKRQDEKKPLLNSVWLWGEGILSDSYSLRSYNRIWSDCSLVKGLLAHAKQESHLFPSCEFRTADIEVPGNYLITLNHYHCSLDFLLRTIESLLKLVQDRTLKQFNIFLGNGQILRWLAPRRKLFGF